MLLSPQAADTAGDAHNAATTAADFAKAQGAQAVANAQDTQVESRAAPLPASAASAHPAAAPSSAAAAATRPYEGDDAPQLDERPPHQLCADREHRRRRAGGNHSCASLIWKGRLSGAEVAQQQVRGRGGSAGNRRQQGRQTGRTLSSRRREKTSGGAPDPPTNAQNHSWRNLQQLQSLSSAADQVAADLVKLQFLLFSFLLTPRLLLILCRLSCVFRNSASAGACGRRCDCAHAVRMMKMSVVSQLCWWVVSEETKRQQKAPAVNGRRKMGAAAVAPEEAAEEKKIVPVG